MVFIKNGDLNLFKRMNGGYGWWWDRQGTTAEILTPRFHPCFWWWACPEVHWWRPGWSCMSSCAVQWRPDATGVPSNPWLPPGSPGSRMVRELFVMAREHAPTIIFMDEAREKTHHLWALRAKIWDPTLAQVDSIGSSRVEGESGGDSEVQRTMLELLNQLDGFEAVPDGSWLTCERWPSMLWIFGWSTLEVFIDIYRGLQGIFGYMWWVRKRKV